MLRDWQELFVIDEHTVQLGAGDRAVRIIGPAQQTLRRLQEHLSNTATQETEADDDAPSDDHAIRVRARRELAAVLLDGLPRPAALLAGQLTYLHLGMLLLRDDHPVDRDDVAAGYSAAAVGLSRAAAVRRACLRHHPEATVSCSAPALLTSPGGQAQPVQPQTVQAQPVNPQPVQPHPGTPQEPVDIQVIFAQRAVAPARLAAAATRAQLVLPVVRHRTRWEIGPLLSRDRGPCPRCLLLHGAAADPHFEAAQTALAEQGRTREQATDSRLPRDEPQSAAVLASLLAREIQLAVDGEFTPQTASRMIGLSTRTGELTLVPVAPHPECDCRLHATTDT